MAFPEKPKRKRADPRPRHVALKQEAFAWAATFYPDEPEKVMALAGYKPSLAGFRKVLESPHVKTRMQDLKERVLCDGWRRQDDIVTEDPTKEDVIKKLWEFATALAPPAASQVTALNALAKHYGISVGVEDGGGGADDEDRPPPLHKRIDAGKFQAAAGGAPVNSGHDQPSSDSASEDGASETPSPSDAPGDDSAAASAPSNAISPLAAPQGAGQI